jgi:hypothetical protein
MLLASAGSSLIFSDNGAHQCWHNAGLAAVAFVPAVRDLYNTLAPADSTVASHVQSWLRDFDDAMVGAVASRPRAQEVRGKFKALRGAEHIDSQSLSALDYTLTARA